MILRQRLLGMLFTMGLIAFAQGCANPGPPPADVNELVAAGFKVLVATTAPQKEHLQRLPPNTVTELQRTGAHYFVYPVAARDQLYVGTPREYAAYQRMRPGTQATPADQHAADMASYLKQDAAMEKATGRDLSDPYFFWPSWDRLWLP
jgi:hypothetical protein